MEITPAPANQGSILLALPYDVVIHIVGLVAATSPHPFADLNSIVTTCKTMYAATKEPVVLRRVALKNEITVKLCNNNRFLVLLDNMAGAGNLGACFLSGLLHVHEGKQQSGLALLQQAASAGHKTAAVMCHELQRQQRM